jgi:hypothetical protein
MMRDLTNSLRRQLHQLTKKQKGNRRLSLDELLRNFDEADHERNFDPPDAIERLLARESAKLKGERDPYGCEGMTEVERRARDWADYHEQERRRLEEQAQEVARPPIGLKELSPSASMNAEDSEQPKGQPATVSE